MKCPNPNCSSNIPADVAHCGYCGLATNFVSTSRAAPRLVSGSNIPAAAGAGASFPVQPSRRSGGLSAFVSRHKVLSFSLIVAVAGLLFIGLVTAIAGGGDTQPPQRDQVPVAFPTQTPFVPPQATAAPRFTFTTVPEATRVRVMPTPMPITGAESVRPTISDIVSDARPSIIEILTTTGTGTGFIVDQTGLLVTNKHVVEGDSQVQVRFESGEAYWGTVLDVHPNLDLAYVQIDSTRQFSPIALGDSDVIRVGDDVIAIGFPLGEQLGQEVTVTRGIISAKRRDVGLLQTDAVLNPGNSGGPLLDAYGCAVGVNTSGIERTEDGRAITGINFAIPINEVKKALGGVSLTSCQPAVAAAAPTHTAIPAGTLTPTQTLVPADTPTVEPSPTPTSTPVPTATSTPSPTPKPTPTRKPTSTPQPTATRVPTPTPQPTATRVPTPTPQPTATPTPRPTPTPTFHWRECGDSSFKYTLRCNQNWSNSSVFSAGGRPFIEVKVKTFQSGESSASFFERHRGELTESRGDHVVFEIGVSRGETLKSRNYVHMEYLLQPSAADCIYHVVDHVFRSRFYPVRNSGFIITAGFCEEQTGLYNAQRETILASFEEYE